MRLLNVETLQLESFPDARNAPPYAILSHRWEDEEVLFEDLQGDNPFAGTMSVASQLEAMQRRIQALEEKVGLQSTTDLEEGPAPDLFRPVELRVNDFAITDDAWDSERMVIGNDMAEPQPQRQRPRVQRKKGWAKVEGCRSTARSFGIPFIWIDTCCIDQKSSSELFESINSMMAWYRDAKMCIAYLADVRREWNHGYWSIPVEFETSEWFKRGWTLQELIAPKEVWFFDRDWQLLGLRSNLAYRITYITRIDKAILEVDGLRKLPRYSVAARLSWAAGRQTTRPEDRAYSLLGLFGVNMPTLYGEGGEAAFFRLQTEIFKVLPDHSILAWEADDSDKSRSASLNLFAKTPDAFRAKRFIQSTSYEGLGLVAHTRLTDKSSQELASPYSIFSHAMRIQLLMRFVQKEGGLSVYSACLGCKMSTSSEILALQLVLVQPGQFQRVASGLKMIPRSAFEQGAWSLRDVFVFSPRPDLTSSTFGFIIPSEFCTVVLKSSRLSNRYGVELGKCTWPMRTDESTGERRFDIRSNTTSLGRAAMVADPAFLEDRPTGLEEVGSLVLRATATNETFAIILTIIACRLKAAIVSGLPLQVFENGHPTGESTEYQWLDISTDVLKEQLPGKGWFFAHAIADRSERAMTHRMVVQLGIQT